MYLPQYKFPNFNKRYDFLLPTEDIIIEVHGEQHYEEDSYFLVKSGRTLKEEQENDQLKQVYAESLGCKYIVVDYREGDTNLTLKRFIEAYAKIKTS